MVRTGQYEDRIPIWARFSASIPDGPDAHPVSHTMGIGFLSLGGKRPVHDVNLTPPPPSAEVEERVDLYLYSPFMLILRATG